MNIIKGGRSIYGEAIGILVLETTYPAIPGNVANASTYQFPVRYKVLEGIPSDWWCDEEGASERRQEIFVQKARELEKEGVRAITTGCGFFAKYQQATSEALTVPVFTSPLLLVPMVSQMIGRAKRVGIITAGENHLKGPFLENVGIDPSIPIAVDGMADKEEFTQTIVLEKKPEMNVPKMETEVVDVAQRLVKTYPDIGALVFECSDLPPFAGAVQAVVNLPIFDFISLINMVYTVVVKQPYLGFM
ncbi:MAG: aspartate/glutamate racemase family protein [Desulfobacterales bacterium]|jgi:aspartate/glutamate racemase